MPQQVDPIDGLRDDVDGLTKRMDRLQVTLDRIADELPARLSAAATSLESIQRSIEQPRHRWRGLAGPITWGVLLGSLAAATIAYMALSTLIT